MWINKFSRRKNTPGSVTLHETGDVPLRKDHPRKIPARPLLWACLVVAALMLTAFVVFNAENSLVKTPPAPASETIPTQP